MKANEANQLTSKNLKGPVIAPHLELIYEEVRRAAEEGRFEMELRTAALSGPVEAQLFNVLRAEGYEIKHHPDPDPGHPCSHPYKTLSWKAIGEARPRVNTNQYDPV